MITAFKHVLAVLIIINCNEKTNVILTALVHD